VRRAPETARRQSSMDRPSVFGRRGLRPAEKTPHSRPRSRSGARSPRSLNAVHRFRTGARPASEERATFSRDSAPMASMRCHNHLSRRHSRVGGRPRGTGIFALDRVDMVRPECASAGASKGRYLLIMSSRNGLQPYPVCRASGFATSAGSSRRWMKMCGLAHRCVRSLAARPKG
jgi:hypothetical protein